MTSTSKLERRLENILHKIENQNTKIEKIFTILNNLQRDNGKVDKPIGYKSTSRLREQTEQTEQLVTKYKQMRERHRELLFVLIENGFLSYREIARKLNISKSRARAYVSDLKNNYSVPLKMIRDAEGFKVGIDIRTFAKISI